MFNILNKLFYKNFDGPSNIIKFLGIKFSYYDYKKGLLSTTLDMNKNLAQIAYNFLMTASEDDLYCFKTGNILFIFNKGCLELDYDFFRDYVITFGYTAGIFEFLKLDKSSVLYKEHIDRVKNGEFLWKYVERFYYISHSFISKDKNTGEIYINSSYIKEENMIKSEYKIQHVPSVSKRKYIKGIAVGDYIKGKSKDERIAIVDKLLNYIFTSYRASDDPNKISGKMFDCHLYNFIIGQDGLFHFIDFDLKSTESLDREYCIYFMLFRYDKILYKKMLELYKLKDKHKYYMANFSIYKQPLTRNGKSIITEEHKKLSRKYFGGEGLKPDYKLSYLKTGC